MASSTEEAPRRIINEDLLNPGFGSRPTL